MIRRLLIIFLLIQSHREHAQSDSTVKYRSRKIFLTGSAVVAGGGSLAYLHDAWYKKFNTGRFHFFNDNGEWLQMDKAGHAFTGYQTGRLFMEAYQWAGFSRRQQLVFGGTTGFVYLAIIEVFDGFSRGWGFSWGDMAANASGSALSIAQEVLWERQRFQLKFSFYRSGLAKYNPSLLGEKPAARILKDYNGQIYWISFNPFHLHKNSGSVFPRWLNLAVGYGATGMTGGHSNITNVTDENGNQLFFERQRICYLSLDIDLTQIHCKSPALRGILSALNVLKVPFPAISVGKNGLGGHFFR